MQAAVMRDVPQRLEEGMRMGRWLTRSRIVAVSSCVCSGPALAGVQAQGPAPVQVVMSDRGQGIAPIYEGWYEAPDGTVRASFGYLSLNSKEELDIPGGPNNRIDP